MAYAYYNPNPVGKNVGDCAVRAVSKALSTDWHTAFALIAANGYSLCDMPSSDSIIGATLRQHGFKKAVIPNTFPDCYTAEEFAESHPHGVYVLGFGGHVATIVDGILYDSWDSRQETPIFYWYRKDAS